VVIAGGGGVGKSTLVLQLTTGKFVEEWDPTLEDIYHHKLQVDGKECLLDIYDMAGQAEYR
jgi:GTPase KRas protein